MSRSRVELAHLRLTVTDGVIRSDELRAAGVSGYAVSARCRPSGPWQRLLPGVVLMTTGPPTRLQRLRAAVAYAGAGSLVTGADALRAQGIPVPAPAEVLVLLPATRRAASRSDLTVERTARLPIPVWRDAVPYAPLTRATIDAARHEHELERLHTILYTPLQADACTVTDLLAELSAGNQRGSAAPRAVLTRWLIHNEPIVLPPSGLSADLGSAASF